MDDITAEESKIVDELRRRTIKDVTSKMLEDVSLFYRFAKARDFNLVEAESMLRKHIAWRKEMQIDTILTDYEPPEILVKYSASSFVCFDKEGSMVRHNDCGRTDVKNLFNAVTKKELAKYFAYIIEKDKDLLIKKGRNLGKPMYSPIYNFEDLSYANAINIKTLQYLPYIMKMVVDNYPESIRRLFIINVFSAPFYFSWIFSAIKPVTPKVVLQKFGIYGADGWKEDLLEIVNAADLPAFLGGTKTDPDGNPLCETFIRRGQPIPRSYCIRREIGKLSLISDEETLTVKPFSKEDISFKVTKENSYLEWEFELKNRDIDFSLLFQTKSSEYFKPIELVPKQRTDASEVPEKGCFKCEKAGIYTMVFDNSYSWLYTKEVHYRVEIKDAKNQEMCSSI